MFWNIVVTFLQAPHNVLAGISRPGHSNDIVRSSVSDILTRVLDVPSGTLYDILRSSVSNILTGGSLDVPSGTLEGGCIFYSIPIFR